MRMTIRGGENETVELEELQNGQVQVTFSNSTLRHVSQIVDIRDHPTIIKWVHFANEFLAGVREGVTVNGKPIVPSPKPRPKMS